MRKWILFFVPLFFVLTGCIEERYRYPCQDPENWENKECKKPYCSANGTCPEDLRHYEKEKAPVAVPQINKGECK
jgi:hypothetical protein